MILTTNKIVYDFVGTLRYSFMRVILLLGQALEVHFQPLLHFGLEYVVYEDFGVSLAAGQKSRQCRIPEPEFDSLPRQH